MGLNLFLVRSMIKLKKNSGYLRVEMTYPRYWICGGLIGPKNNLIYSLEGVLLYEKENTGRIY